MPGPALGVALSVGKALAKKLWKKNAKKVVSAVVKHGGKVIGAATIGGAVITARGGSRGNQTQGGFGDIVAGGSSTAPGTFFSGGARRVAAVDGMCPKGWHLNKSRSGDGSPPRSFCTRNRSINFANGRAAGRAGRRLRGTVKMLKRSFSLVSAKPMKGKLIPKKRK